MVRVAEPGDYSTYTLRLVTSAIDASLPQNFDPQFAAIDFDGDGGDHASIFIFPEAPA